MASLLTRAVPFLNNLIPAGLAVRGISSINPRLANFVTTSLSSGYTADNIMEYLRDKIGSPSEEEEREGLKSRVASGMARPDELKAARNRKQNELGKTVGSTAIGLTAGLMGSAPQVQLPLPGAGMVGQQQPSPHPPKAPQQQAIQNPSAPTQKQIGGPQFGPFDYLSQFDPSLSQFVEQHLGQGKTPRGAAILAKRSQSFGKLVSSIEEYTKLDFDKLLESLFKDIKITPNVNPQGKQEAAQAFNQRPKPVNPQPQQNTGQSPGDKALMDAASKILSM